MYQIQPSEQRGVLKYYKPCYLVKRERPDGIVKRRCVASVHLVITDFSPLAKQSQTTTNRTAGSAHMCRANGTWHTALQSTTPG